MFKSGATLDSSFAQNSVRIVYVVLEPVNEQIGAPLNTDLDVFSDRKALGELLFHTHLRLDELAVELADEFREDVGLLH